MYVEEAYKHMNATLQHAATAGMSSLLGSGSASTGVTDAGNSNIQQVGGTDDFNKAVQRMREAKGPGPFRMQDVYREMSKGKLVQR